MRVFKKSLAIYLSITILSVINYACCGETNYRITGNGVISAFDINTSNSYLGNDSQGIVTGAFNLTVSHETKAVAQLPNLNLIQSTYATSCPETFVNDLNADSFRITSNSAFTYNGSNIAAGTNLITLDEVEYDLSWASIFVDFNESFMSNADFANETHEFTIEVLTTDGVLLQNSISIKFEIGS